MAEVNWVKIKVNMFDDEKIKLIEAMPEGDSILVVFLKLLTLAGKTNANGYIYFQESIAYSEEMLATIFNKNLQTLRLAIVTLRKFHMIEIEENGYIFLKNFEKHQNSDGLARIRQQAANRQRKFRERANTLLNQHSGSESNVTCNATGNGEVTQSNATDIDIEEDIDKERDKSKSSGGKNSDEVKKLRSDDKSKSVDSRSGAERIESGTPTNFTDKSELEQGEEQNSGRRSPAKASGDDRNKREGENSDFIGDLIEIFKEEYQAAKQVPYLDGKVDRGQMGILLGKLKKAFPGYDSAEMLGISRLIFRKCCNISDDKFYSEITIPKLNSQINQFLNKIKNGTNNGNRKGSSSIAEINEFLAEQAAMLNKD